MEDNKKDIPESPMMSEEGKQELYMYSVLKMAKGEFRQHENSIDWVIWIKAIFI